MEIPIKGMTCQGCAQRIEQAVALLSGARNVHVNFGLKKISVEGADLAAIKHAVDGLGYEAIVQSDDKSEEVFQTAVSEKISSEEESETRKAFLLAALGGVPEFFFGMGIFFAHVPLLIQALLAGFVVLVAGFSIHVATVRQFRKGYLTMDSLVTLGSCAALIQSLILWWQGTTHVGFESASTIVLFVLFGRYLESKTRRKTLSATAELYKTFEKTVTKIFDDKEEQINGLKLKKGDVIILRPGEVSPVDGVILTGNAQLGEALITGEPMPRQVGPGDSVTSGAAVTDSLLKLRVERTGRESFLGRILVELEKAQGQPVKLQRFADRLTSFFVPAVILIASVAALVQFVLNNNPHLAFNIFLSVVLVACPCALGLAIPMALVAGIGLASKSGILFRDASVLEASSQIKEIFFDKTGTLTEGAPSLVEVQFFAGFDEKNLVLLAASLESYVVHPLADAFKKKADDLGIKKLERVENLRLIPGKGIEGIIEGKKLSLVRAEQSHSSFTASELFLEEKKIGRFYFTDPVRPVASSVLRNLAARGLRLHLITGDSQSVAESVAHKIAGDETLFDSVRGGLLPLQKQEIVLNAEKSAPGKSAFVGDGVNDVLALSTATIGFAVASGAPGAIGSGNVTLARGIRDLPLAFDLSAKTLKQIYFNFFWALAYNAVMLPAAVLGYFKPVWASLAMSLSSVSVVLASLLFLLHSPKSDFEEKNFTSES